MHPVQFLNLPREIRSIIYVHYLYQESGYFYNYNTNKLETRAHGNGRIDLNLMYTCQTIAEEMRGLVLGTNTITFETAYDRRRAGLFQEFMQDREWQVCFLLDNACYHLPIDQEIIDRVATKHPTYLPVLEQLRETAGSDDLPNIDDVAETSQGVGNDISDAVAHSSSSVNAGENTDVAPDDKSDASSVDSWHPDMHNWYSHPPGHSTMYPFHEAPSVHRDFIRILTKCISERFDFTRLVNYTKRVGGEDWDVPRILLSLDWSPWSIPSDMQMKEIRGCKPTFMRDSFMPRFKYHFSAASVAIRFLSNLSYRKRMQLRSIKLDENHYSVQNPECHAIGLIPFCIENSRLKIERRASLWGNILQAKVKSGDVVWLSRYKDGGDYYDNRMGIHPLPNERHQVKASEITWCFTPWISEAIQLQHAGMPKESFSLVVDGGQLPEQSTQILERLKRDAAWYEAFSQWLVQHNLPVPHSEIRWDTCFQEGFYHSDGYRQSIKDISEGNSLIRCNFSVPYMDVILDLDAQQILQENGSCTNFKEWRKNWDMDCIEYRAPILLSPLPTWLDIQAEQILVADAEELKADAAAGYV